MSDNPDKFKLGDRVRLSALGKARSPRIKSKAGRIISIPKSLTGRATIEVLFDGNKRGTRMHCSYLERDAGDSAHTDLAPRESGNS